MKFVSIRVGALALVSAGLVGSAVGADPGSAAAAGCTFSPSSATVSGGDALTSFSFVGGPFYYGETFIDTEFVSGAPLSPATDVNGPSWSEELVGKTWRIEIKQYTNQPVGDILCTFSVTYEGAGGETDGDSGGRFGWDFDLDRYLQRSVAEDGLPDTL